MRNSRENNQLPNGTELASAVDLWLKTGHNGRVKRVPHQYALDASAAAKEKQGLPSIDSTDYWASTLLSRMYPTIPNGTPFYLGRQLREQFEIRKGDLISRINRFFIDDIQKEVATDAASSLTLENVSDFAQRRHGEYVQLALRQKRGSELRRGAQKQVILWERIAALSQEAYEQDKRLQLENT